MCRVFRARAFPSHTSTLFFAVILPVLYTVSAMPINLFFVSSTSAVWDAIDTTVSVLFGVDILLCFFSAYIDANGVLITDKYDSVSGCARSAFDARL